MGEKTAPAFLAVLAFMIAAATGALLMPQTAIAAHDVEEQTPAETLASALTRELTRSYPGAKVELIGQPRWSLGSQLPRSVGQVATRGESLRGAELNFTVTDADTGKQSSGTIAFSAWMPARIALRRILPGTALSDDQFKVQEINVASGMAREYRGLILEPETAISRLETRQTVLEGQFLASSAVQRMPDVRRGDAVRVQIVSGALSLSTQGIAGEPGYLNGQLKVMTGKNKRELTGMLTSGGIVEVKL